MSNEKVVSLDAWRKGSTASSPLGRTATPTIKVREERSGVGSIMRNFLAETPVGKESKGGAMAYLLICLDVETMLNGLVDVPQNQRKINESVKLAEEYSFAQLFKTLGEATVSDVATKPHYYQALLSVGQRRAEEAFLSPTAGEPPEGTQK